MRPLTRVSLSFLFLVSVEAASKKPKPTLDGLYIVREFFSDNGPSWYYHIVDVKFENGSSVIQHIRIAPMDLMCRGMVVQAASVTLSETSGSTLLGGTDLCSMDEKEVKRALNRATLKNKWIFDTARYGIVAKCGADERIFHLPFTDVMNFKRLKAASPQVEGLYDLFSDVVKRSFGKSPFNDVPAETERKTFQDGKLALPALLSGRFDRGFAKFCGVWLDPRCDPRPARSALADYIESLDAGVKVVLVNAEELHLSKFISPDYPPRATKARIQGRVELELIADPVSGAVKETRLIRGHPLFHESALAAARMWRFDTSQQMLDKPVKAVLDYLWACPPEQPLTPPAFAAPESSNRR